MSLPRTQCLGSSTFTPPPLDFSLSIPALHDWHLERSPHHVLFVFAEDDGGIRNVTWMEAVSAIHRMSRLIHGFTTTPLGQRAPIGVVAILATSDAITYFSLVVAITRLGLTAFPISPRNSAEAIAALLLQTKTSHLLISPEDSIVKLSESALHSLPNNISIQVHNVPYFDEIFIEETLPSYDTSGVIGQQAVEVNLDSHAMILHSSGSTSFPKPIVWTHRSWIESARFPWYGDIDLTGRIIACNSLPMFHAMGIVHIAFAVSCGVTLTVFPPRRSAVVPNPVNVLQAAINTKSDYLFCVPAFLETWAQDPKSIEALSKLRGVLWGGGPLAKDVGDLLASRAVKLFLVYGTTETGVISSYLSDVTSSDWEYFRFATQRDFRLVSDKNGITEATIVAKGNYAPCVVNATCDGQNAYLLSDLYLPHPVKSNLWRIYGRRDDQITHSTGEKTNPGPLEDILRTDPRIKSAVLFGSGHFHCGVVVDPNEEIKFDPSDVEKLARFRECIWPTVQRMNEFAPTHSRLFKEMILVAPPAKPFHYTLKGATRRALILSEYNAEITGAYEDVERRLNVESDEPLVWDRASVLAFIRGIVRRTLMISDGPLSDNANLFNIGCDSLQATWIRHSILRSIRRKHPDIADTLPFDFVYTHPTVTALCSYVLNSVSPASEAFHMRDMDGLMNISHSKERLHSLVRKYREGILAPSVESGSANGLSGDVVLLTGCTGSFGCVVLAHFLESPYVKRVYSLGRTSNGGKVDGSLLEKHIIAFQKAGLDVDLTKSDKFTIINCDLHSNNVGIEEVHLLEIRSSLTHIIHIAWTVDFKLTVTSFERDILGLRNLVNLAMSCTVRPLPKFIFVSSVAAVQHASSPVGEHSFESPDVAVGSGYAESKWVAEQVLDHVSRQSPLRTIIVRPGQLTGSPKGAWKEKEWFPGLIKTSLTLRCFPELEGQVSWISSTVAASALEDISHVGSTRYFHIAHPRPMKWSTLVAYLSELLHISSIPYADWLALLEKFYEKILSSPKSHDELRASIREIPSLQLIELLRSHARNAEDSSRELLGAPVLSCESTIAASVSMRDASMKHIDKSDVQKWVDYWHSTGFLN